MKLAFPLSLKVSLWLLANLLLLGVVGGAFFLTQAGIGWDSMVAGFAGDRLQTIGQVVGAELRTQPRDTWDALLARVSTAYGIQFTLFRNDGLQLAGTPMTLPEPVRARLELGSSRVPLPKDASPPYLRGEGRDRPPEMSGALPGQRDRARGRFVQRAGSPSAYWIGIRLPVPARTENRPPDPATLLARAPTLWAAAQVLDLKPWLLGAAAVLVVSILFWLPLVRGITRAVRQLTVATESIAEGRFDTRVSSERRDELGALGSAVNRMAGRLETLVHGQKRFLGDVAHELGGPLSRLQMATSILEDRVPPGLQSAVADVREEVQQMSALVNELLDFTRAGLRSREAMLSRVELAPLAARVLDREAAGERITLEVPAEFVVWADGPLLERALGNLVRNALRYAGAAGPIVLSAYAESDTIHVVLTDEGPGVPPEALARLGEPFYRPDSARTRESGGAGLGLAIVRTCVEACRGSVSFSNRSPLGFSAELRFARAR